MTSDRLTATEARIAGLLARGYADAEITDELAVQPQMLDGHLAEVYRKLGVRSRTELALLIGHPSGDLHPHQGGER